MYYNKKQYWNINISIITIVKTDTSLHVYKYLVKQ